MPTIFKEWRDSAENARYPLIDGATLTNGNVTIPENLFLDARLYPIGGGPDQYISKISVTYSTVTIYVSDTSSELCYGEFTDGSDTIALLDTYGRPAGVLVGETDALSTLRSWAYGDHEFTSDQTGLVASVVVPMSQIGVRGLIAEGEVFAGDVYLVGENGVFFTQEDGYIRVDIVGDPLARRKFCEYLYSFDQPWFVQTINSYAPNSFGDFKIMAAGKLASDTALRIYPEAGGMTLSFAGKGLQANG